MKPQQYRIVFFIALTLAGLIMTGGCGSLEKKGPEPFLIRLKPSEYPQFSDDLDYENLAEALTRSMAYLRRVPPDRLYSFGEERFTARHILDSIETFRIFTAGKPGGKELQRFIRSRYLVYRSRGGKESSRVLFTGYYEPSLRGSMTRDSRFKYPVYGKPDDLVTIDLSLFSGKFKGEKKLMGRYTGKDISTVVPYYDRKALKEKNHLEKTAVPLLWVDDPVDLFFLEIQGSGKIVLQDGETLNIHYHTKNGRPYRSIGRYLIDGGKIDRADISMQTIRAYLKAHPHEVDEILNYNESYVFFKIEEEGPLGCLGVPVTPLRSIATDRKVFPPAALGYVSTEKPVRGTFGKRWEPMTRFMLNQDTGGAITGPGRADIFWGNGEYAETAAGHLQHPGELYFLVKKP